MVVINSMFVYHFVDNNLRVAIIFRKEGTAENGGIGNSGYRHFVTLLLVHEMKPFFASIKHNMDF